MTNETSRTNQAGDAAQDVVRRMYTAFGAGDEDGLRAVLHPDVEWNQCPGFPGGARRRGVDDVLAGVLHGNAALWEGFAAPVDELVGSGDRVVALGHYAGTHSVTRRPMRAAAILARARAEEGTS